MMLRSIAVLCMLLTSGAFAAENGPDVRSDPVSQFGYAAGKLLGSGEFTDRMMQVCQTNVPHANYEPTIHLLSSNNGPIQMMAKLKAIAVVHQVEGDKGRKKAERFFETDLPEQVMATLKEKFHTIEDAKVFCDRVVANPEEYFLSRTNTREYNEIFRKQIGYPRRIENCEFTPSFLLQPEVINIDGGVRYIVPESAGPPNITAECSYFLHRIQGQDIKKIIDMDRKYLQSAGFSKISSQQITKNGVNTARTVGRGFKEGISLVYAFYYYIGETSVLRIGVLEPSENYPSIITTQFLDWVRRGP